MWQKSSEISNQRTAEEMVKLGEENKLLNEKVLRLMCGKVMRVREWENVEVKKW